MPAATAAPDTAAAAAAAAEAEAEAEEQRRRTHRKQSCSSSVIRNLKSKKSGADIRRE